MNSVNLVGRLVFSPELKYTPNGVANCQIRLAVDRRFKSESGERKADFFDVVLWRQSAEYIANHGDKGLRVAVEGRLQQDSWEKDGQRQSKVVVVADNVSLIDYAKEEVSSARDMAQELGEDPSDYDPFA